MYVAQITLTQSTPLDYETASDAINRLLSVLHTNGQICGREWPIAVTSTGYLVTVMIPEATALDESHHNSYVRTALLKFQQIGLAQTDCVITEELDGFGACECEQVATYILYTKYTSLEVPLRCGACFLPVPLYRLPRMEDDGYNDIFKWESNYQACDTLWMNCTTIEQTVGWQLSRLDSGLSKQGLELCRQIFQKTGVPTYYYLLRYGGRTMKQERARPCPSCEGEWLLPEPQWHDRFDFRCDRCYLLSNISMVVWDRYWAKNWAV